MLNIKNFAMNVAGAVLPIAVTIFTVPLYINAIGPAQYGALTLVWIVFGYFGVLDLGVGRAVTNAISRVRGEADGVSSGIIWSAIALNAAIGLTIAIPAGAGLYIYASLSANSLLHEIEPAVPLMAVGIAVLTISSTLNGALEGRERFKESNSIQVTGAMLYQLAPLIIALTFSKKLFFLIDAVIISRIAIMVALFVAVNSHFGVARSISPSVREAKSLLKFGSSLAIINIIDPLFSKIDQILIAKFATLQSVAAYNVAANSIGRLNIIPFAISRTLFPRFAASSIEDVQEEMFSIKSKMMLIWFAICAAAIFLVSPVFKLWLHNSISSQASSVAKYIVVAVWANCLSFMPYTALQASGRSKSIIKVHLAELPFYIVAIITLTYQFGPSGAAIANSLRMFCDYILLWKMCNFPVRKQGVFIILFGILMGLAFLV